jgi:hypothetical protein
MSKKTACALPAGVALALIWSIAPMARSQNGDPAPPPYKNSKAPVEQRIEDLLGA